MKWGFLLLLGVTVFASEGENNKEAVAEGNEKVAKDVGPVAIFKREDPFTVVKWVFPRSK